MVRMVVFLRLLPVAVVALYNTAFVGTEKQRRTVRRAEGTHVDLDEVDIRALQELLPLREARTEARCVVIGEAAPRGEEEKAALVKRLLAAKRFSGKTFDEIAKELGYTNAYTAPQRVTKARSKRVTRGRPDLEVDLAHEILHTSDWHDRFTRGQWGIHSIQIAIPFHSIWGVFW
ncbi:unnamed protein product [Durusdinium trenchii]|uniref:Peptidyl-prolyl cis-trans isomerase n=1 Tax=Durusdinium trenchii TaxID=1381693 RepID=A0ABP0NFF4_9DINO